MRAEDQATGKVQSGFSTRSKKNRNLTVPPTTEKDDSVYSKSNENLNPTKSVHTDHASSVEAHVKQRSSMNASARSMGISEISN